MPAENLDDLDLLLRDDDYIPDDGFSRRVALEIASARRVPTRTLVLGASFALALVVLAILLGEYLPFWAERLAALSAIGAGGPSAAFTHNPALIAAMVLGEIVLSFLVLHLARRAAQRWDY